MDWEKAKKIFIYMLVVLNAVLFVLNYSVGSRYKITQKEEAAVYRVLSENGMGIYCDLIKENKPMRLLSVSAAGYEAENFRKMFFGENENVETILEFDRVILKGGGKTLEIKDNNIKLYCDGGTGEIANFGAQTAKEAAESFARQMTAEGHNESSIEKIYKDGEKYVFEFDEMFSGFKIFSNTIRIDVAQKGVVYAEASYFDVGSFYGDKQEICSCDEALLTVMYKVLEEGGSVGRYIENIEKGYDFQSAADVYDPVSIKLVPCYRIYVSGVEKPYRVNAYTNEIIEYAE